MRAGCLLSNERSLVDVSARIVVAFVSAALAGALLDALARVTWTGVAFGTHVAASLGLFLVFGAFAGAAIAAGVWLSSLLPFPRWHRPALAVGVGWALHETIVSLFAGRLARSSAILSWGPLALSVCCTVAIFIVLPSIVRAHDEARRRQWRRPLVFALVAAGLCALLVAADLTLFVSLYGGLHTLLEIAAALAFAVIAGLFLVAISVRCPRTRSIVRVLALLSIGWTVLFALADPIRRIHERALRHTWREPVYAGRMLRRMQMAEALVGLRTDVSAISSAPFQLLRERFQIQDASLHPRWRKAKAVSTELQRDLAALREGKADFDIVIYYVDTLRHDVALDAEIMPELARFSRTAMNFRRAYATGSDTLHSLPALVGGRYRMDETCGAALLPAARRSKVTSSLFIPESAYQFLSTTLPSFSFDGVHRILDHRDDQSVWGYGADKPTAGALVDGALDWLAREHPSRRITWLFNFDLHNWRELERAHVDAVAAHHGILEEGAWNWQYRVVARSIDAEFGRLLDGLERLGRSERTIVLFVSDHGEGLGYQGFWVHSVFLWESLVRVPLLLRVPGLPPADIDQTVSLVDVAPTLARFIDPGVPVGDCHGMDLLTHLSRHRPARRPPALLVAASEGKISKLGVVDDERKLVVPLDWGEPQLYDLRSMTPDESDVAELEPSRMADMVDELVRSPIFEGNASDEGIRASR